MGTKVTSSDASECANDFETRRLARGNQGSEKRKRHGEPEGEPRDARAHVEEGEVPYFPFFHVSPSVAGLAFGLAVALSFLAALIPARQAARLEVVSALRRVG